MPFAIEFYLDEVSSTRVRSIWDDMVHQGLGQPMAGHPHITVAVWEDLDLPLTRDWLAGYASTLAPFPVGFASVGFFANNPAVAFLAPIVTRDLLDLQQRFSDEFMGGLGSSWLYYQPGRWVPHCTIAMGLDDAAFPRAMEVAKHIELPFDGMLTSIGILEFPAIVDHGTVPLTGHSATVAPAPTGGHYS
jgi:2'-5' RNA ligase